VVNLDEDEAFLVVQIFDFVWDENSLNDDEIELLNKLRKFLRECDEEKGKENG